MSFALASVSGGGLTCFVLQAVNEKQSVIQEYESGKAIPNNQVLGKLERALGVKLRGKS